MTEPLWRPSEEKVENANLTAFMRGLEMSQGVALADYEALYDFSLDSMENFWTELWDFAGVVAETRGERVLVGPDKMPGRNSFQMQS